MSDLTSTRLAAKKRICQSGLLEKIAELPREVCASCDGCGYLSPWLASTADRYGLPMDIAVCPRCALVSQVRRFTPESAMRFYNGFYRPLVSAFHGSLIDGRSAAAETYATAARLTWILELFRTEVDGKAWVDVGGGTGASVARFMAEGLAPGRVLIVDPSADELRLGKDKGFDTLQQVAEDPTGWCAGEFDLLLCLETIDHTIDLTKVMKNINAALRDGGLALITVGDYLATRPVVDGKPRLDLQVDHTYHFTSAWMERTSPAWGFRLERRGLVAPGHAVWIVRKVSDVQWPLADCDDATPSAKECRRSAEDVFARAVHPVCPEEPPTFRQRLYCIKRRLLRALRPAGWRVGQP